MLLPPQASELSFAPRVLPALALEQPPRARSRSCSLLRAALLCACASNAAAQVGATGETANDGAGPAPGSAGSPPGATDAQDAPGPAGAADEAFPVHGQLSLRSRLRRTSGGSDADLYGFLSFDAGDPEVHALTFHSASRLAWDLDAGDDPLFDGIDDTYSHALTARLYDAWVDVHGVERVPLVRIGRQSDYETPDPVLYDGVRLESAALGSREARLGVYGGLANHLYESSPSGDYLGGVYVDGRPWAQGRARVDWLRAQDELTAGQENASLVGLSVWQTFSQQLRARGAYTLLEGQNRDLDVSAAWYDPEPELTVRASWYRLFETQAANPLEFDTFATTLFDLFPFDRYGVVVAKRLTQRVHAELGTDLRDVRDDADEGTFNRDVWRTWLTGTFDLSLATSLSVTGDTWQSHEQETSSLGASVEHEFSERTSGALGTYYALYEFDSLLVQERENVRVYYVQAERELSDTLDLLAGFDFEDADIDFTTLKVRLSWRF